MAAERPEQRSQTGRPLRSNGSINVSAATNTCRHNTKLFEEVLYIYYLYLTANGFPPGGSGTTTRHNTQITHIIHVVRAGAIWRAIGKGESVKNVM
jgi:hypothetical protein